MLAAETITVAKREKPAIVARRRARVCRGALLCFCLSLIAFSEILSAPPNDDPGKELKERFESAKAALAAGDLAAAEARYRETIAVGLRQLGNLGISEGQFEQATNRFDEAMGLEPEDAGLRVDAAIAWFRRGDDAKAIQLADAVLTRHPENARAHNVLGRIRLSQGDTDGAIAQLRQAVTLEDDFETSYFLGIAYLKGKKLSDAAAWFAEVESRVGDSAALHVLFGRAYTITHFPKPAMAEFEKAIKLDPKYPRAHGLLGYANLELYGEEAYPRARAEFEQELKLHPGQYYFLTLLGITTVALRDFPAAESALSRAVRLDPNSPGPYLYLGETYSETNRLAQAVEALQKYLKMIQDPQEMPRDVSRAYFLLGRGLLRMGRVEEGKKALAESQRYREAKFQHDVEHMFDEKPGAPGGESHTTSDRVAGLLEAQAPREQNAAEDMAQEGMQIKRGISVPAGQSLEESNSTKQYRAFVGEILGSSYNDLGVMRAKAANFTDAAEYFKKAGEWSPNLPGLDRNWGLASYRAGLYADAIPPLERELAAHPEDRFIRQLLGLSYFSTDDPQKTVEVLRAFQENPPDDPGLLYAWGTALVRTNNSAAAATIFRRLLEQNANNPQVHLLLGEAFAQQRDYTNALTEFRRALDLDRGLPDAHDYAGRVYLLQGNLEAAEAEFQAELRLRPNNSLAAYHLGFALLSQGNAADAIPLLRKALAATPGYEPAAFELGRALLETGDLQGAIENLEAARKLRPDREATWYQLSQAYRRAGRANDAASALATYQKMIEASRQKRRQSFEEP